MEMNGMGNYYYDPNGMYLNTAFQGQPMYFGGQPIQPISPSLTDEEFQFARQSNNNGSPLDLGVDRIDLIRAMCNHRDSKGQDVVQIKSDGSAWCPICLASWNIEERTKEEVTALIDDVLSLMQIAKWAGNIPINIIRDFFQIMPLLAKFPDVYDYAMKNFNRMIGGNGILFNTDAMPYAQYNAMFPGGSMNYNVVNPFNAGYYQQGYQQQPNGMMNQQQQMGQMANPTLNPMQAQTGFNPQNMAYNPQMQAGQMPIQNGFINQPGYYQQSYYPNGMMMNQQPYQPNFGVAQNPQAQQQVPPTQQSTPVTTETKAEL